MRRLVVVVLTFLVLLGVAAGPSHAAPLTFDLSSYWALTGNLVKVTGVGCSDANTPNPDGSLWFGSDPATSPFQVPIDAAPDGSFGATFVVPNVSPGEYPVNVTCGTATNNQTMVVGSWNPDYLLTRWAGADRYRTAAVISAQAFAPGVKVALVASGENYPDALAAAPAGSTLRSPVLLTRRDVLPAATTTELRRLKPRHIVVVGGTGAVSAEVAAQLVSLGIAPVQRWAGRDRYETAALTARMAFAGQADLHAFVASGQRFPDALSGASVGYPLLLTQRSTVPASTITALQKIRPESVGVIGGTAVVTSGVQSQLDTVVPYVYRLAGANRYATAAVVADGFHRDPSSRLVLFVASGQAYPDALAGAAVAGMTRGALLLTEADGLPTSTQTEIKRLQPNNIIILGGKGAVSDTVRDALFALITHQP